MSDDDNTRGETISLVGRLPARGAVWSPVSGPATASLGERLIDEGWLPDSGAFDLIKQDALRVFSQTAKPEGDEAWRTGLVVGYVQSGKTMSMTTLAALARDNGFRIVIVFAGVTKLLLRQTRDRFQDALQPPGQWAPTWKVIDSENSSNLEGASLELQNLLQQWKQPSSASTPESPTLLLVVMKHHAHLRRLAELLGRFDLTGVPALIIDDEADQAGLNTKVSKGQVSSTHQHIAAVRHQLPHHSYLQFTATPQAPLLISLIDMLSPDFAEVLEPGEGYTGGEAFFRDKSPLVVSLPHEDLFSAGEPPDEPPETLKTSLMEFIVGATACGIEAREGPFSMLIHPSMQKGDHKAYVRWAQKIRQLWSSLLALPTADPDRLELLDEARRAYDELVTTDPSLPPFDAIGNGLLKTLSGLEITEVNSDSGDEVKWLNGYAHVLVGGEKLNRGFTVKGLMLTYMPRNPGGWSADTIQQRARFFGYKADYLERCRVYLHPEVFRAYRDYVEHEAHIRKQLIVWRGKPLLDWKRAFFLEGRLRPTRRNVLDDPYYKMKPNAGWSFQSQPHDEAIRSTNRELVDQLLSRLALEPFEHTGSDSDRHLVGYLPLRAVFDDLLVPYKAVGHHDVKWLYAVRVWLEELLERQPGAHACVLHMDQSELAPGSGSRRRTAKSGRIPQLFQGRDKREYGSYPGDRAMRDEERVTLQIHELTVDTPDGQTAKDVAAIAVHVPKALPQVLVQPKER